MNSPFEDPGVSIEAAKRQAILEAAAKRGRFPVAPRPDGSRFAPETTNGGSILDLLSRFLQPGSQTAPASPRFNQEGVEDEVIQK